MSFLFVRAAQGAHGVPPGGDAAAEGPVQVEAAAHPGAVQRFAHEVQPRTALELEAGFQFGQTQPAAVGIDVDADGKITGLF